MRKRIKVKPRSGKQACQNHTWILEWNPRLGQWKISCSRCKRFYGYVGTVKDLEFYKAQMAKDKCIDFNRIKWGVTDYMNRSDNTRRKKEPVYDPRTDSLVCECGKVYFGTRCPGCGRQRDIRKTTGRKIRWRQKK